MSVNGIKPNSGPDIDLGLALIFGLVGIILVFLIWAMKDTPEDRKRKACVARPTDR